MKSNTLNGQFCLIDMETSKQTHEFYNSILQERIEQYGSDTLLDEELLSLITGIPVADAKKYLYEYGLPELIKFSDSFRITKAQRRKLELLYLFVKKVSTSTFKDRIIINSSIKAGEYFVKQLQFLRNEVFMISLLDNQNRIISTETIFEGTINECPVYPRLIVKRVLDKNANSIILAHNHPGGTVSASAADLDVTKKISRSMEAIQVKVIDHIIVAEDRYTSFAEKGLLG